MTTIYAASDLRRAMPQANLDPYLAAITGVCKSAAHKGLSQARFYDGGDHGIRDMHRMETGNTESLAAHVAAALRQLGYKVRFEASSTIDPREHIPASMIVDW